MFYLMFGTIGRAILLSTCKKTWAQKRIRINPDVIFVPTIYSVKQSEYKQDIDAIMHDPELQNVTAVKKGYVYPINDMHIMSYSSWMYYEMEQMSKWLYGDWSYKNYVKYQSMPAN